MEINEKMKSLSSQHPIVIFDGVCHLCNVTVQWIILRDSLGKFKFVPSQSDCLSISATEVNNSVILVSNGIAYMKSDAVLRILKFLGGFYYILFLFGNLIPSFIANRIYDFIASRRYRWFGKYSSCMAPKPEWKERFLV